MEITTHNGQLQLEITELAFSSLYSVSPTEMRTDMSGIRLKKLANGNIELIQQGSQNRELLVSGQFSRAKAAYIKLYTRQPELLSIRGNSMGILATHLRARHNSQKLYDQVREITVAMHGFPIYSWLDW